MNSTELIIVSGQSGSGKSTALHALEDLGFYCIDNLPIALLSAFGEQLLAADPGGPRAAVGIDVRNFQDPAAFPAMIQALEARGITCQVLYLTAERGVLVNRFNETRRRHPLASSDRTLHDAVALEQVRLTPIADLATRRLDTTRLNVYELREQVRVLVGDGGQPMTLLLQSFAYRHGAPADADLVFDMRCLPNPYWQPELRELTGQDAAVVAFLDTSADTAALRADLTQFLQTWLPRLRLGDRGVLHVALGCTGGRHRSVYMAARLAQAFTAPDLRVLVRHRDLPAALQNPGAVAPDPARPAPG